MTIKSIKTTKYSDIFAVIIAHVPNYSKTKTNWQLWAGHKIMIMITFIRKKVYTYITYKKRTYKTSK